MKYFALLILCSLFNIATFERIKMQTVAPEKGKLFSYFPLKTKYLEFNVKSDRDVNIKLCNQFNFDGPYYEIVIGGVGNTLSVIKKLQSGNYSTTHTEAIMKNDVYQRFWIYMNDTEESISVGRSAGKPFLYLQDPDYVRMSYFGISSGWGSKASWDFDLDMLKYSHCS